MEAVLFTNFSDKLFASPNHPTHPGDDEHCQWGGIPYAFLPGQSVYLEVGVAGVMAKHLITRECFRKGLDSVRGQMKEGNDPIGKDRITKPIVDQLKSLCLDSEIVKIADPMQLMELNRSLAETMFRKQQEAVKEVVEEEVIEEPVNVYIEQPKRRGRPNKQS